MTLRRDHAAAVALLALGVAVLLLGHDLPFGTAASPGPGMLPTLAAGLMMALALALLVRAGASPPLATIAWDDLGHAAVVMVAACAAAALYPTLGFVVTFALLLLGLMVGVERMPAVTSLLIAGAVTGGTYFLLGSLLRTPLPRGILGI